MEYISQKVAAYVQFVLVFMTFTLFFPFSPFSRERGGGNAPLIVDIIKAVRDRKITFQGNNIQLIENKQIRYV